MFKDVFNANPANILAGEQAVLTQSATAVRDDVLVKQAGRIVGRMQLKDTVASIDQTVRQVADGKYRGTLLMGTRETAGAYAGKAAGQVTQQMTSTGISSTDTARIAAKALGRMPPAPVLAAAAGRAGVAGVAIGAGLEAALSARNLLRGDIPGGEFAARVARAGVSGGASLAAATTGSSLAATGAAATLSAVGLATAPAWVPAAIGVGAAIAAGTAVSGLFREILGVGKPLQPLRAPCSEQHHLA